MYVYIKYESNSPVLVTLPSAIAITTHLSTVLSGWIVQVTVMLYSWLATGEHISMGVAVTTEEATS